MQTHTHSYTDAGHKNTIACLPAGGPVRRKQPNKTNNKKKSESRKTTAEKRERTCPCEGCEQVGGSRRKFGFDKHHFSHSKEKYNQKNIEAVILQTSVSFLVHEGQRAV